jgi:putative nucleotidyltransferase with HDIG domain
MSTAAISLDRIQSCVDALPALPQAVREVMQALQRDDVSVERSVHLIEQDQSLAARTLRVANSAFYGMSGRVGRIGDAVTLLGLRAVSGVLLAVSFSQGLDTSRCAGFHFRGYWRHSMATALAARLLAPRLRLDPDEGFVAGLLHDIGKLVLAAHFPAEGAQAMALARSADVSDIEAERATLGLTHAEIGAVLVRHWRFPAGWSRPSSTTTNPPSSATRRAQPGRADRGGQCRGPCTGPGRGPAGGGAAARSRPLAAAGSERHGGLALLAGVEQGVEDMCRALSL